MKRNVFLLLSLCISVIVSSCSGFKKLEQIQSSDFFSGINCTIPLEIPYALPTSEYLHTNDTIEELKLKLDELSKEMGNFTTEYLPYNKLMMIYSENNKTALYLFHDYSSRPNSEDPYKYKYRFSDFSAYLTINLIREKQDDIRGVKGIPIPHHLFEEMSSGHYYVSGERLVKGDIDEFFEFYQTFQKYYTECSIEISKSDDVLTLENIPVVFEIEGEKGAIRKEIGILKQFTLTFSKNSDNQSIVTFSYNLSSSMISKINRR